MSEKLSEQLSMISGALKTTNPLRGRRIAHIAKKVAALESSLQEALDGRDFDVKHLTQAAAALEQQLAAKDAEIARLRELLSNRLPHQLESAALAETPAAPEAK